MKKFLFVLFCANLYGSLSSALVGQKTQILTDIYRNRILKTFIWYPAPDSLKALPLSKGPFQPVIAVENSPIKKQRAKFPVVLLSHGSGGTAEKLFWIVENLVKNGFIVIAPNHAGNMTGDNSGRGVIEVWKRPQDLTFALNQISKMPDFKSHLDLTKIAVIGHSAGGTTALLLRGAKFAANQFQSPVPNCIGTKDPYFALWCADIQKINLKKAYDPQIVAGDYSDPRIKMAIAIDPGFAKSFDLESLQKIGSSTYVYIADKLFTPFDEIYSKDFLKLLPKGHAEILPESVHMTFIQACKPDFNKEDPELRELCANNDKKIEIQRQINTMIISNLK